MQITEIYKSLQGESTHAGLPCVFVRLTGCNLRCSWCDSEYTFTGGVRMSSDQVMSEVARLSPNGGLVEITGGEPMLQERELVPFMQQLLDRGYTALIETSGERPLANVPKRVIKIVDVKCPHSGEGDSFDVSNLEALQAHDEVKFVISNRADYEFARAFTFEHKLAARVNAVLFSPAFRKEATGARDSSHCLLDPQQLAEWMLADDVQGRLGLQIHKFIWDPAVKGVLAEGTANRGTCGNGALPIKWPTGLADFGI
jgi:7-carboxy-7-deazaguanine synthase